MITHRLILSYCGLHSYCRALCRAINLGLQRFTCHVLVFRPHGQSCTVHPTPKFYRHYWQSFAFFITFELALLAIVFLFCLSDAAYKWVERDDTLMTPLAASLALYLAVCSSSALLVAAWPLILGCDGDWTCLSAFVPAPQTETAILLFRLVILKTRVLKLGRSAVLDRLLFDSEPCLSWWPGCTAELSTTGCSCTHPHP